MNKKLAFFFLGGAALLTALLVLLVIMNRDLFLSRFGTVVRPRAKEAGSQGRRPSPRTGTDAIDKEIQAYRYSTRMAYNGRRFDELERLADEARATKARFGNGSWKIYQFYGSLGCSDGEPESMWQLHDAIHREWIAAKPESITARTAQIDFLVDYAWRARGSGYADTVGADGWRVFGDRLKLAHHAMDESRQLTAKCPVWWGAGMGLALGEGWDHDVYQRFYEEAKAYEPNYFNYDIQRSNFLATKWYGEPGDWEQAAEKAAADPNGPGMEIYARCVLFQHDNYQNVFRESKASWPKAQEGFELMRQRYPDSLEVASGYCRMACLAGDRAAAKRLFDVLGPNAFSSVWGSQEALKRDRNWANGES